MVEQWNIDGGTVWLKSGTVMVEQCEGTVEQLCGNSGVEQWNSDDGMVWWNSGTVLMEHW